MLQIRIRNLDIKEAKIQILSIKTQDTRLKFQNQGDLAKVNVTAYCLR
jgi:hypothetical protein